jgi:DNA-binding LacI/PurR family transcriptional regulator
MGSFLLRRRHLRAAYISPFHAEAWSQNRLQGLTQFYRDAGHPDAVVPATADHIGWLSADRLPASIMAAADEEPNRKLRLEETLPAGIDGLLANRDITAWVAANDAVGIACLRLLAERGIRVPARISVASFDDSFFALVNDLTSYNFNTPAVVQAMIQFIVNPSWPPVRRRTGEAVEVDGFVNERESTGTSTPRQAARGL